MKITNFISKTCRALLLVVVTVVLLGCAPPDLAPAFVAVTNNQGLLVIILVLVLPNIVCWLFYLFNNFFSGIRSFLLGIKHRFNKTMQAITEVFSLHLVG
jgi:hypothetical protein